MADQAAQSSFPMSTSHRVLLIATVAAYAVGSPVLLMIYWPAQWPLDVVNHAVGRDFVNIWAAGRLVLDGQIGTLFNPPAYLSALRRLLHPDLAPHIWSYPPTSLLFAVPLGALPYGLALAVWTLTGLAAFVAVGRLGLVAQQARMVAILLVLAPATLNNIVCGQNGFFTAALLGGGFLLLDRRPLLAGFLLGLLSYKPHLGLVVIPALVALGAWRAIGVAALTTVLLIVLSLLAFGTEPWRLFVSVTVANQASMLEAFQGFFTRMLVSPYSGLRHLGWSHGVAMAVQVVLLLATVAAVVTLVRRARDADSVLALVAAGTFVASPYALTYDLPILALVIARHAERHHEWTRAEACLFGLTWALPLLTIQLLLAGIPIPALVLAAVLVLVATETAARPRKLQQGPARPKQTSLHGADSGAAWRRLSRSSSGM
jgi:Glycosyltransferase family 87